MSEHDQFVTHVRSHFGGATITAEYRYETSKEAVLRMLREENRHKPPLERWKSACRVFLDLHKRLDEPQKSWAARVIDEDLTQMLAALHKAGLGLDFTSAWLEKYSILEDKWRPNFQV